jgi:hypothetical protein
MCFTHLGDDVLSRTKADCEAPNACPPQAQLAYLRYLICIKMAQCGASESLALPTDTLESRSYSFAHSNPFLFGHRRQQGDHHVFEGAAGIQVRSVKLL